MSRLYRALALAVVLTSASAQFGLAQSISVREACRADVHKFCSGMFLGGAITRCMKQHASEVSAPCKAAWAAQHRDSGQTPSSNATAPS